MRENPYPGINAHLNSLLQTPSTLEQPTIWPSFHSRHITYITDALNAQLPDHYMAHSEQSAQSRGLEESGIISLHKPKPDVTVFRQGRGEAMAELAVLEAPTWEASLEEVTEEVRQFHAAIIREILPQGTLGQIVARIELLSPSNKPGGGHYDTYAVKRLEAIETGVPLIEIDYLHESPSVIRQLPVYPEDADAVPYSILVSDPRPNFHEGRLRVYGFGVGDPIRTFPLPLAGDDMLKFDLNPVYQHTFRAGRWSNVVTYTTEPVRFEKYRADDQAKIRAVMNRLTE